MDSIHHLMLLFLGFGLTWTLALVVYRLNFHPLARFPGPKITAATYWYEFYYDILSGLGGQFAFQIDEMHKQYGPIVRINPDELHVQDPEFHAELYAGPLQVRDKYERHAKMTGATHGSFSTVHHHHHRLRRAAIAPIYSKKTVIERQSLVQGQVAHLCQVIQRQCRHYGSCDVRTTFLAYATEVVMNYFFNEQTGLLDDDQAAIFWRETIEAVTFLTSYAKQFNWLIPIAKQLPVTVVSLLSKRLGNAVKVHKDMKDRARAAHASVLSLKDTASSTETQAYTKRNGQFSTIFETIQASQLPVEEKLPERMADEGVEVLAAGSETVSRTLRTAAFHLLDNPDSCRRLQDELREALPDPLQIPDVAKLEQLTYLNAVMKESLRLASITTSRSPLVSPSEALRFNDWVIPIGTPVSMTSHKILMNTEIYSAPEIFRPERWIGDSAEVQRATHHFVAFQTGNRACIGINLGQAELRLVIAVLFRRFDFELVDTIRGRDIDPIRDCYVGMPMPDTHGVQIAIRRELP